MKNYGNRILKIRKMIGLSQEEFGDEIGVSRQTISKWETGEQEPRITKIRKICQLSDIKFEDFISEEDDAEEKISKIIYENKKKKVIEKRKIVKARIQKIAIISITVILFIYLLTSITKLIYLTSLNKKMLKFKELNNYYFTMQTYIGNVSVDTKNVWYLDGKYKIEEINENYNQTLNENHVITFINLENNTETKYRKISVQNSEQYEKIKEAEINSKNKILYENGKFLYNSFPTILQKDKKEILKAYFKIGIIKIKEKDKEICIKINNKEITIDKETKIPIKESNYKSTKDNSPIVRFIQVKFDCVNNNDVEKEN